MNNEKLDGGAMSIGFGLFGLAAGMVCALTLTAGASTSLMTSMFTFVGGAILSYSAFKVPIPKKREDSEPGPRINVFRVGLGLGTFSMGLIAGVIAGMWIRYKDPFGFLPKTPPQVIIDKLAIADKDKNKNEQESPMPDNVRELGVHSGSGATTTRERVQDRLKTQFYDKPGALAEARADLAELLGSCR